MNSKKTIKFVKYTKAGKNMQSNTKKYIQNLFDDLEVQLNTVEGELKDTVKIRRKLQKVFKKISRNFN